MKRERVPIEKRKPDEKGNICVHLMPGAEQIKARKINEKTEKLLGSEDLLAAGYSKRNVAKLASMLAAAMTPVATLHPISYTTIQGRKLNADVVGGKGEVEAEAGEQGADSITEEEPAVEEDQDDLEDALEEAEDGESTTPRWEELLEFMTHHYPELFYTEMSSMFSNPDMQGRQHTCEDEEDSQSGSQVDSKE